MNSPNTYIATSLPPPSERYTIIGWIRKNLFNTWLNTLLTLITLMGLTAVAKPLFNWVFSQANWEVIQVNLRLLQVGQYPLEEMWRVLLCLHLLAANIGLSAGVWLKKGRKVIFVALLLIPILVSLSPIETEIRLHLCVFFLAAFLSYGLGILMGSKLRHFAISLWVLYFPMVIILIGGLPFAEEWLPIVPSNLWGGLLLTFLLTVVGISFSFPVGVFLALGRRSNLPAIRWVSIFYIEVIRGVPLVTILFMASVMVPLFLPDGMRPDRVLRAMVGIVLFSAAYMAENVRGGLQAIPRGQYEAAYALGLSGFHTMALVILPQALRTVIPVIMGLFIALFKDTSLVTTIGLLELLGISRSILAQPQYVSYQREVLLFISLIYWVFSYFMSYVSQRLETALGVGER